MLITDKNALYIMSKLESNSYTAYAVGGCVRDALLGRTVNDIDIATSASPEETKRVFSDKKVVETGIRHGTVTVIVDGKPYEVTTYRVESGYGDQRHPDHVDFVDDVEADLSRRDFTVNAMAYSPVRGLVDPFGGREDVEKGVIRCVGDPYRRFGEDALRIMRALRFSSVLGFEIEPNTARALHELKDNLQNISVERIYAELKKLVLGARAGETVKAFADVISAVAPVSDTNGAFASLPADAAMRFACLFGSNCGEVLRSLRCDNATVRAASDYALSRPIPKDEIGKRFYAAAYGRAHAPEVALYRRILFGEDPSDSVGAICADFGCLSVRELAVKGNDLKKIGFSGGAISRGLDILLDRVIRGETDNDKHELVSFASEILKNGVDNL